MSHTPAHWASIVIDKRIKEMRALKNQHDELLLKTLLIHMVLAEKRPGSLCEYKAAVDGARAAIAKAEDKS